MERRQFLQSTVLSAAATMLRVAPPAATATPLLVPPGTGRSRGKNDKGRKSQRNL